MQFLYFIHLLITHKKNLYIYENYKKKNYLSQCHDFVNKSTLVFGAQNDFSNPRKEEMKVLRNSEGIFKKKCETEAKQQQTKN